MQLGDENALCHSLCKWRINQHLIYQPQKTLHILRELNNVMIKNGCNPFNWMLMLHYIEMSVDGQGFPFWGLPQGGPGPLWLPSRCF